MDCFHSMSLQHDIQLIEQKHNDLVANQNEIFEAANQQAQLELKELSEKLMKAEQLSREEASLAINKLIEEADKKLGEK